MGVIDSLKKRRLKDAIQELRGYASRYPEARAEERLERIERDYGLMLNFMRRGYKDEKREEVYEGLARKLLLLECDTMLAADIRRKRLYADAYAQMANKHWEHDLIRYTLENFVSDLAMTSLEDDTMRLQKERELYRRHYDFMSVLFRKLWLSPQWSETEAEFYKSLLTSPTIDERDALLMVSALTLSVLHLMDVNKFRTLVYVYTNTTHRRIRQRALVGWAFAADANADMFSEQQALVSELCRDKEVCRELLELQMQVVYCLNAERDTQTIQSDLLPTLIKNNRLRVTRFGIEEKEDDPLEDILDPGASDRAMEEMEKTVERMMSMQKAGSDIYFGGFRMMKSFTFFQDIANWLSPFYMEHPALTHIVDKTSGSRILANVVQNGPFCDSDKYSFALMFTSVLDKIPPSMREVLDSGEVMDINLGKDEMNTPAYIRRIYLQDLYRFFCLHPQRSDLDNPFATAVDKPRKHARCLFFASGIFRHTLLSEHVVELCNFLLKQGRTKELNLVIENFEASGNTELTQHPGFLILSAIRCEYMGQNKRASELYEQILRQNPDHVRALKGLARICFNTERLERAAACYAHLTELQPEKRNLQLRYCIVLLRQGQNEEAMKRVYKLDYEYPDDMNVQRVKAWGLMATNKLEQAREVYERLRSHEKGVAADWLNAGYCEWFCGEVGQAADFFAAYLDRLPEEDKHPIVQDFTHDSDFLHRHGITDTDMALMNDLL